MTEMKKDKRVYALRGIGAAMLLLGIAAAVRGNYSSCACFCSSASVINASNIISRKNKENNKE